MRRRLPALVDTAVLSKVCRRCGTERTADEFYSCRTTRDRLSSWCRPCHSVARHARYMANREQELARSRAYELANPERTREKARRSYHNNKPAAMARHKKWVEENPDRTRAINRNWYKNNTEVAKAKAAVGRARRLGAAGTATARQLADRIAMFGGKCWMCGKSADTIDHVIPIAKGGTHWPANLRPACGPCNYGKQDRIIHHGY